MAHPINFTFSPEKMAYSFAYISMMAKAFGIKEDKYRFLTYLDSSVEPNLKMHYLFACSNYHKGKKISLFTLAGEKKKEVKKALLKTVSEAGSEKKIADNEVISMYPCPFLKRLKEKTRA